MFNDTARAEYEQNIINLVLDLRKKWNRPDLPVVVGELGNEGENAGAHMKANSKHKPLHAIARNRGKTLVVKTTQFHRPKEES